MECIYAEQIAQTGPPGAVPGSAPADAAHVSFHQVLSALNPLQYLPVVGSIYRAVTGDVVPEPVRIAGSLIVSGLTGGPIGVAVNAAVTAMEKATGIDPDHLTHEVLADIGLVHEETSPPSLAGWSDAQYAAYALAAPLTAGFPVPMPLEAAPAERHAAATAYAQAAQLDWSGGSRG